MTDNKSRPPSRSEAPEAESGELRQQRDAFVHTFFKKGVEFTEELLRENERLRHQVVKVEHENSMLRTQLKSDQAIRDALTKIEQLEREKDDLLSQFNAAEAVTTRFTGRYAEIEEELSNLANLYVASYQLHSTLDLGLVVKHLRELLAQLVGARSHAIYVSDEKKRQLVPVATDGVDLATLQRIQLVDGGEPPQGAAGLVERVFLTGIPMINEGPLADSNAASPPACVPMRIDDRIVGVIIVYSVLPQKEHFVSVDFELFKMLGAHAATALMSAMIFHDKGGKLPGLDSFRDLETPRTA
jgi:GAF domain-containing protein